MRSSKNNKLIAICQPNYIPWKGYFDNINYVDELIVDDYVQFTRRDWRNRNKIKTQHGTSWLSIPVQSKGNFYQSISKVKTTNNLWRREHWETIRRNYSKANYFKQYKELFEYLYLGSSEQMLTNINQMFTKEICSLLDIKTKFSHIQSYLYNKESYEDKTDRLIDICRKSNANKYLTGPAAKNFLNEEKFKSKGIEVIYFDYSEYPRYKQLYGSFEHEVSIVDLIFNTGPYVKDFMRSYKKGGVSGEVKCTSRESREVLLRKA